MSESSSIRVRLLQTLSVVLSVGLLLIAAAIFLSSSREINEVYDANLQRAAITLEKLLLHEEGEHDAYVAQAKLIQNEIPPEQLKNYPVLSANLDAILRNTLEANESVYLPQLEKRDDEYVNALVFTVKHDDGTVLLADDSGIKIPMEPLGYSRQAFANQEWRVFVERGLDKHSTIAVAERVDMRDELIWYITLDSVIPLLIGFPLMLMIIITTINYHFRPITKVAEAVRLRRADDHESLQITDVPNELMPMVKALNALFQRVSLAIVRERQFTSEAAHELRTPLAALKTNVQVAMGRLEHSPAQDDLVAIDNGITRLSAVVDQLLIIARVDSLESAQLPREHFNVHQFCSNVIGDVAQIAYEQQIELSLVVDESLQLSQHQALLEIALRNLLENAIKHAHASQIELTANQTGQQLILKVMDDGVGFADDILSNATERFSRGRSTQAEGVTGVGLGLAIVKRIAQLMNAELTIENGCEKGASVTLIIPL